METRQENQLIKRLSNLVQQNKELSMELRRLSEKYKKLQEKQDEYELIIRKYGQYKEVKEAILSEKSKTVKFSMATVAYADIHGFSEILPGTDSEGLIDQLDHILHEFDEIVKKYSLTKNRTIGDSYMCAGGIPLKNITNPVEVVLAALEMLNLVKAAEYNHKTFWEVRLAVHTGPVTAIVNGKTKTSYDIKGDTVNIASRMESSGVNGRLLISVMTYELIKEFFDCEYYGKLPVKYKGLLDIYSVTGLKPELSVDGLGNIANEQFQSKFGLIQFHDLQEEVLDILERDLPSDLYYHNLKHTVDVVTEVELIGWAEGINDDDLLILKTAALFHDVGHIVAYNNHEFHGTQIARLILPKYKYTGEQIDKVCAIILSTKMPPSPKNILEEIICDSDLDYLGRIDFIPVSNTLYEELKVRDMIGSLNDWNKLQLKFISNHQYFTQTAQKLREVNKQNQIERIRLLIT
jgi:adenylate cyclase